MGSERTVPGRAAERNALNTDLSKSCTVRSNSARAGENGQSIRLTGSLVRPLAADWIPLPGQPPDQPEPARLLGWRLGVGQQHHHAGPAHRRPVEADRATG